MSAKAFGAVAGRAIRTAAGKADSRARLIGAVRAACRRQGIGEEDRRAIQLEVTGKASMAEMNPADIGKLLDRLNRDYKGPMGHRAHVGKIRALWWVLYWIGAAEQPNEDAVNAFVKRQTGKEKIQFLGPREAFKVIEALKSWARREGVRWPGEADLAGMKTPGINMSRLERHAVLSALALKLQEAGVLRGWGYEVYCQKALSLPVDQFSWTEHQLDAAIRMLGKKLRRALGRKEGGE